MTINNNFLILIIIIIFLDEEIEIFNLININNTSSDLTESPGSNTDDTESSSTNNWIQEITNSDRNKEINLNLNQNNNNYNDNNENIKYKEKSNNFQIKENYVDDNQNNLLKLKSLKKIDHSSTENENNSESEFYEKEGKRKSSTVQFFEEKNDFVYHDKLAKVVEEVVRNDHRHETKNIDQTDNKMNEIREIRMRMLQREKDKEIEKNKKIEKSKKIDENKRNSTAYGYQNKENENEDEDDVSSDNLDFENFDNINKYNNNDNNNNNYNKNNDNKNNNNKDVFDNNDNNDNSDSDSIFRDDFYPASPMYPITPFRGKMYMDTDGGTQVGSESASPLGLNSPVSSNPFGGVERLVDYMIASSSSPAAL